MPAGTSPARPWPVSLIHGAITLRPRRLTDYRPWSALRERNRAWLDPWEPTHAGAVRARDSLLSFYRGHRDAQLEAREQRLMPFVVLHGPALVGQVNLGPIHWGPVRSTEIGYWIDRQRAGQGITPIAAALAIGHAFACGLHRVQATIAPDNSASIRVAQKLGMRHEGTLQRYLHVQGDWRDHHLFALTADDDLAAVHALISR